MKTLINPFIEIYEDAFKAPTLHEKILQLIIATWAAGLLALFVVGFITLIYGIVSGQADIENATFGVFDTLGS